MAFRLLRSPDMRPDSSSFSSVADDQTALACRSIHRMILDGGLLPGHRPSHRHLAESLGLGRSPVRDAILRLEAEGLVAADSEAAERSAAKRAAAAVRRLKRP